MRPAAESRQVPRGVLLGALVYLGAYLSLHALPDSIDHEAIGDFAFLPLTAAAAVASWRAGQRVGENTAPRAGWRLITLALVFYGLGDAVQLSYEAGGGEYPSPSLADPLYLAFYPLFFAGILCFPSVAGVGSGRRQAIFDAVTVSIGGAAVVWYLVLGPTAYADAGSLLGNLVALGYPAGDLILIAALARVWMSPDGLGMRRPLAWLSAGVVLYVIADVIYSWTVLNSVYAGGGWLDTLWMVAAITFLFAAVSQPAPVEVKPLERAPVVRDRQLGLGLATLPYLAVAVVFSMLLGSQAGDSFFPGLSLTLTAALVAALVLVRQYLAQRDLAVLNEELRVAHTKLAALATTDPLTSLPNHRALVDAIDRELDRAKRYQRNCSFLFIDIDYFKALNDGCGHAAGDTVLRELSELMGETLRTVDTLGRWGGEEFVAVLPEITPEAGLATAERLRSAVAEHSFRDTASTHLTISAGVASFPRDGASREVLLEAADRAMYTAKHMGRNQVFSASDPTVNALHGGKTQSESDERATMSAVDALAMLVEARDRGSGDGVGTVARLAERVALALGCTPAQAREVYLAAKLHDIGKVAVADSILRKPGRLSEEEWELMRKHPLVGADVVSRVGQLASLAPIIRSHHEHYDGGGYPEGLRGEEIPLEARIVGVADAFEAMISKRPYRSPMELEQAREELRRCAGSQFDPDVVAALERVLANEHEPRAA